MVVHVPSHIHGVPDAEFICNYLRCSEGACRALEQALRSVSLGWRMDIDIESLASINWNYVPK